MPQGRDPQYFQNLLDVNLQTPADGQGLIFDAASGFWKNTSVTGRLSTLTFAATTNIDFTGDRYKIEALTGDVTFTTSNLSAGVVKELRLLASGGARNLTFPAWIFVGGATPTALASGKYARLVLTSWGTTDADVVAQYSVQS